ncbi:Undecaprenyl-diphosphatase [Desulfamplus magnetovallimortis]|uniref:Undecaprenyl-diphosphatase n=1 Tax=Desulfamplus magnetovallimortis TaxID=1246637 RepID=A0A1W1HBB2_9BACT|nr:undecaprenyl-diphosphate phosphatase [Desulfamplus magnetovallimortis]SLM29729.1 Undecaprenyl-diphosphatase [Desulfamplus magnetovallimortis]
METYQAIILGILQGLTEFLPVSSSGHLALGQQTFGITEPTLFFDVSLHIGTLMAVVVVFFDEIRSMLQSLFALLGKILKFNKGIMEDTTKNTNKSIREDIIKQDIIKQADIKLVMLIIVGSIPTAILGLFFKQYVDILFTSINFVGCMLLVTGTFLWLTRNLQQSESGIMEMTFKQAIIIGICQGVAVLPGISRSGSTISASLFMGINRETAGRFSFILSIPAIVGAELLSLKDFFDKGISFDISILYGTLISFVVGYLALIVLLRIVRQGKLYLFAPYCWILGAVAVVCGVM